MRIGSPSRAAGMLSSMLPYVDLEERFTSPSRMFIITKLRLSLLAITLTISIDFSSSLRLTRTRVV